MRGNPLGLVWGLSIAVLWSLASPLTGLAAPGRADYIKAVYSLPLSLDPIRMNDTASLVAGNLIYDGLLRFSPTLTIEGALAETWETSSDGKALTFSLRKGLRFHNGDPITAEDVVASLKRALSPESQVRKYFESIESMAALDPRTVVIQLKHPFPPFLSILAGGTAKVLPRGLLNEPGFFDHPVGSGPFKFASRMKSPLKQVELAAFDGYYRGKPSAPHLTLRELTESEATRAALAGELDDLSNWPLTSSNPIFKVGKNISSPVAATWIIGLNVRSRPFSSTSLRQLFKADVNAEAFRQSFYPDALPAAGYVPPGLPGYATDPVLPIPGNIRRPKDLIKLVIPKELSRSEEMRVFIENNLRSKGWNARVLTMDWSDLMKGYEQKTHQAFLVSMNLDYPDAEFLLRNFESGNSDNFSGLRNKELDRLLADARTLQDRKQREVLYKRAIRILDGEAVTVNLFHPRANYWVSNCVSGFEPNILADVYIDYAKVSLKPNCAEKGAR